MQYSDKQSSTKNVTDISIAPAIAMATLYQELAFSSGLLAMQAVAAQKQTNMLHTVVTAKCCQQLIEGINHK